MTATSRIFVGLLVAAGACARGSHGSPTDAGGDAVHPLAGRRAFVVTSTFIPALRGSPMPATHAFTLVLDDDSGQAFISSTEGIGKGPFTATDGNTFQIAGPAMFWFGMTCPLTVSYEDMTVTVLPDGHLTGSARGKTTVPRVDAVMISDLTAVLDGVPDTEAPTVRFYADDPSEPMIPFVLLGSELLPPDAKVTLSSGSGDRLTLEPWSTDDVAPAVRGFMPNQMLRFGETYVVETDDLVDFAGNFAGNKGMTLELTTHGDGTALLAEDGFESAPGQILGNFVIEGAAQPVISGEKSLFLLPSSPAGSATILTLRLHVDPGDTVVRFSYRTVNESPADSPRALFRVGVVGKPVTSVALPLVDNEPRTQFQALGGITMLAGPVHVMEIPLPGAGDEVYFSRTTPYVPYCTQGGPIPATQGIIIDDVRVE